jgi:type VII secretion-associated serine protease mycosin
MLGITRVFGLGMALFMASTSAVSGVAAVGPVRSAAPSGMSVGTGASADAVAEAGALTDEIRDSQQWVLNMLDVNAAWQVSQGAGVKVAVLDSGVDPDVSDLTGSVTSGPDLTGLHTPPSNPNWGVHGTWMASIIAGHGHDGGGSGIIGIAPKAKILSIRVIPDKSDPGFHTYNSEQEQRIQQSLATGIRDAVHDGAEVISMSIGYSSPSGVVRGAIQYAFQHGVVLVASSGNSGQDDERHDDGFAPVSFPAEYPGVLGVAALNPDGSVADFSSNNLSVQVAAPGVNVPAQGRDGQYWLVSGTSPACALVAGVAALIKSRYPRLAPGLVDQALTTTAQNGPSGGYNVRAGFGEVDAAAALSAAGRLEASHPARSPVPVSANFGGGPASVSAEPVAPRGVGELVLFAVLAVVSLLLAAGAGIGLVVLRRSQRSGGGIGSPGSLDGSPGGAHAAYFGQPGTGSGYGAAPGYRYGGSPGHGGPPGYGDLPGHGTDWADEQR